MQIKNGRIMYQIINNIKIFALSFHIMECYPHCDNVLFYIKYSFYWSDHSPLSSRTFAAVLEWEIRYCPFGAISPISDGAWFVSACAAVVSGVYPGP